MTTAINEGCIWRLHENCYLVRRIFMMQKAGIFLLPGGILPPPPPPRIFTKWQVWGKAQHTPSMVWETNNMKVGGTFLVRCGKGDNSARHCFVLTDLNPTNFFKYVIIMKMCTTDKIFYKICLKASRDIFFQMLSAIKGGMG